MGSTLRLSSRLGIAYTTEVENRLEQRTDQGWEAVEQSGLTPLERGFGWLLCPTMRYGARYAELRSVRIPSADVARRLLAGLEPYDLDGQALPDITLAGRRFLLLESEARIFVERATAEGAFIKKADLDLLGAQQALRRGEDAVSLIADAVAADEAILADAASRGIYTHVTSLAQREDIWLSKQRVEQAMADADEALVGLAARGGSTQELVQATALGLQLEQLRAHAGALMTEHIAQARRAALLLTKLDPGTLPPQSSMQQRGLYGAVAEHLARTGQAAYLNAENELVITLAHGRSVVLGERVRVDEPLN